MITLDSRVTPLINCAVALLASAMTVSSLLAAGEQNFGSWVSVAPP